MPSDYDNKKDYSRYKVDGYPVRHREKNPFSPQFTLNMRMHGLINEIRSMDSELKGFMLSENDYVSLANEAYASNLHPDERDWTDRTREDQGRRCLCQRSQRIRILHRMSAWQCGNGTRYAGRLVEQLPLRRVRHSHGVLPRIREYPSLRGWKRTHRACVFPSHPQRIGPEELRPLKVRGKTPIRYGHILQPAGLHRHDRQLHTADTLCRRITA